MDEERFDAMTRRRFGLAAGGFASALLGLARLGSGQADKVGKNQKKR
jgi:hypothetical protein